MNSQDLRNLQEAYLDVYQEVDESATRIAPKIRGAKDDVKYMDGRSPGGMSISGNSQVSGAGYMQRGGGVQTQTNPNMPPVNPGRMDRGTRIDLKYRQAQLKAKGGSASSAGAGSASGTTGRDQYKVGGGEGYGVLGIKLANSYEPDLYDVILEYLLDEGYAETPEAALAIMGNMSEDWRESIAEDAAYNTLKGFGYPGALVSVGLNKLSGGKIAKPDQPTVKSTPTPKAPTVSSSGGAGGKVTVDKQYPATLNKEKGMKSTGETGTEYFTPNIRGTDITDFDKAQYKNTYTNTYKDIPARQSTKNPQSHLSRTGVPRVYARTASYGIDD